ncbi:hypothetical protein [Bacillus clarus]|uniref:Uncharacterized protein n=1 Tax=Bacillus clarus TaxID=2338372 RepID=A0A090YCI7_9BACI|nr:hypothetical protein [Bacillus clarus]KFM95547.1 hypothetical protein DJ93_5414 [Bacillus clarus]
MDSLIILLHDAVKVFFTVFATACANELAKKLSNKKHKRTASACKRKGGSKRK